MNILSYHGDVCIKITHEGSREKRESSPKCSVFPYISRRHYEFIFTTLMDIKYYGLWIYRKFVKQNIQLRFYQLSILKS